MDELLPSLRLLIGIDRLVQNRRRLRRATREGLERHLLGGDAGSARTRYRHWEIIEDPAQNAFGIGVIEYRRPP